MRLQKILSRAGVASRRQAEELLRQGRVTVNGRAAHLGEAARWPGDEIRVDGRLVPPPAPARVLALHKPYGYVTTLRDPQGRPTVRQLLPPGERLVPIGRLDQDSEGLLLFTNDGDLAQAVAHPSGGVAKRYRVWVHAPVSSAVLAQLRAGVHLEDGWCRPLEVHVVPAYRAEAGLSLDPARRPPGPWHVLDITLGEGRKREVRRLLARVGLRVYRLVRVAVGPIPLTGLPPGQYRYLEEEEMRALRARPAAGCGAGRAQMRLRRVQSPGGPSQAPAGCRKG